MHGADLGNYAYGMWPVLTFAYYRLAMREEKGVEHEFGQAWRDYKQKVPAFVPRLGKGGA